MSSPVFNYSSWIDPATGLPIDPSTGQDVSPTTPSSGAASNPYAGMNVNLSDSGVAHQGIQNRGLIDTAGTNQGANLQALQNSTEAAQQTYGGVTNTTLATMGANPGYTQAQTNEIYNPSALTSGETTPGEFSSLYATPGQTSAIEGQPGTFSSGLSTYLPYATNAIGTEQSQLGNVVSTGQNTASTAETGELGTLSAADANSALTPGAGYYSDLASNLGTTAGTIAAASANPNLQLQLDPSQYEMSNSEVAAMENQAGLAAQASYASQEQQVRQAAQASGSNDPMAMAAYQGQVGAQEASSAANAVNQAQIQAEDAQRATELSYAQAALGAGTTQSQLEQAGAEATGALGENTYQNAESTALDAAQAQQAAMTGQAETLAGQQIGAGENYAALNAGELQNVAGQQVGVGEFGATTGTGVSEAQNTAATTAAAQLLANQQAQQQYQYSTQFQQPLTAQEAASGEAQNVSQAQLQSEENLLGTEAGLYSTTLGGVNTQAGLENQNIGNTNSALNTSTQGQGQFNLGQNAQSLGGAFTQALGTSLGSLPGIAAADAGGGNYTSTPSNTLSSTSEGQAVNNLPVGGGSTNPFSVSNGAGYAEGGIVTEPETFHVGENFRPEAILPLDPATPPKERNPFEKMGARLGKHLGIRRTPFLRHEPRYV